jgi:hypothetical protein
MYAAMSTADLLVHLQTIVDALKERAVRSRVATPPTDAERARMERRHRGPFRDENDDEYYSVCRGVGCGCRYYLKDNEDEPPANVDIATLYVYRLNAFPKERMAEARAELTALAGGDVRKARAIPNQPYGFVTYDTHVEAVRAAAALRAKGCFVSFGCFK